MCERLPGDRCSHHVQQEVDKKTLKAASIFVASGADSPQELTGKNKEAYDSAVAELRAAQEELTHTPTEIKKRAAEARKARAAGNIAYAEELEVSVVASEELRARRKAGLKHLRDAEKQVGRSMISAAYQNEEAKQVQSEVDATVEEATKGLRGKNKEEAVLKTARDSQAAGRREIARLKKARTQLDKDLSKAVDAGNAAEAEAVLGKIQKSIQKISYANARNEKYQSKADEITRSHRPVSSGYHSAGCGGGCGGGAYVTPEPAPTRSASRKTAPSKAPRTKPDPTPVRVRPSYGGGGCGGGGC